MTFQQLQSGLRYPHHPFFRRILFASPALLLDVDRRDVRSDRLKPFDQVFVAAFDLIHV